MLSPEASARKDKTSGLSEMQHRHFATIATIIRAMRNNPSLHVNRDNVAAIAAHFADELAHTNPKFDRARFLRACE